MRYICIQTTLFNRLSAWSMTNLASAEPVAEPVSEAVKQFNAAHFQPEPAQPIQPIQPIPQPKKAPEEKRRESSSTGPSGGIALRAAGPEIKVLESAVEVLRGELAQVSATLQGRVEALQAETDKKYLNTPLKSILKASTSTRLIRSCLKE